jgi:DNA-damage-inducible protein J
MIHVRLDENLKNEAVSALEAMGLSLSDAIRVFLTRVVAEQQIPFTLRVPNAETQQAIHEARAMTQARFANSGELFDALNQS